MRSSRMSRSAVISVLAISLLLTACGGSGSSAPSGGAATKTGAPADAQKAPETAKKTASVAIVPAGPHPYFVPMEAAIADATKEFKLAKGVYKTPSEWNLNLQNQLLATLASQGFDAFGIFPGDANGSNATIADLVGRGAPVVTVGGCVNEPTKASFCLATDVAQSAYLGTKELIKAMGGKGKIMHATGLLVDPNTQLRIAAVKKAAEETNGAVTVMQTLSDVDDQQKADQAINAFLAAHKSDVDGIITTAYIPSVVAATALRNLGDKRIKMVGIDDDPIVLDAIKDGFLYGTMAQNPYGQAYMGAYVLNELKQGCKVKTGAKFMVDTGTLLISKDNRTSYADQLKDITKKLVASFKDTYLTCA